MQSADIASIYGHHRPYFFAIAYNLTGEVHEAEDIIHDVFEKLLQGSASTPADAKAYLARMVVNRALDRLEQRKREGATYIGPWLPEPIMTESDESLSEDLLPFAVLCLLEQLNPIERAVLILRDAFAFEYAEIANFCNIREDNCRQIAHRAKERVKRPLRHPHTDDEQQKRLMHSFLEASFSGDIEALSTLLQEDIVLYSDGGGKAAAATKPLVGPLSIAKFFAGFGKRPEAELVTHDYSYVNGQEVVILWYEGVITSVFIPVVEEGRIATLFVLRNPDKIFFTEAVTK